MNRARLAALVAVLLVLAVFGVRHALRPRLGPGVVLWDTDFSGEHFAGGDASNAILWNARLRNADLTRANFSGAKLGGADLQAARLEGADLSGANLCLANLRDANLRGANLRGADLQGAHLAGADLLLVNSDEKTRWPANFRLPGTQPAASTAPKPDTVRIRVTKVASTPTHLEWKWVLTSTKTCPVGVVEREGQSTSSIVNPDTTNELHLNATYRDTQAAKAAGHTVPGLWQEWKETTIQKSRYGSGQGQSATSLYSPHQPLQPALARLDEDLTVSIPTELPLVTVGGKTRILQLGSGFPAVAPSVARVFDLSAWAGFVLLAGLAGMLFLAIRLMRRRARNPN